MMVLYFVNLLPTYTEDKLAKWNTAFRMMPMCVCSIVPDRCFCWLLLLILTDSVCSQTHLSHMAGLPCVVATGAGLGVRRVPDSRPEHAAPHRDLL